MNFMPTLPLTPDELLTTTRSVRKRLDLTRDVPIDGSSQMGMGEWRASWAC